MKVQTLLEWEDEFRDLSKNYHPYALVHRWTSQVTAREYVRLLRTSNQLSRGGLR